MLQLYRNIKNRRIELGLTQSSLAERLGYADKSMIAKIEKGVIDLPQSKIIAFSKALNIEPGDLMGWGDVDSDHIPPTPNTIAAHFDGDEYSEEQIERIKAFAKFIKSEDN